MRGSNTLDTRDKLMLAAIELIAEKGYNSVTTQEIAEEAGLSEKTLFRHFGSKLNLLETAIDRFHYAEEMKRLFNEEIVWDLQADLFLVSRTYHKIMNRNGKLLRIAMKEAGNIPGLHERAHRHPQELLKCLTEYFTVMIDKGKLIETNPEHIAVSFMLLNFGAFLNNLDSNDTHFPRVPLEAFIQQSVQIFTRGLTP